VAQLVASSNEPNIMINSPVLAYIESSSTLLCNANLP
jgi:hypothetical protein